jgi:hypothetical protein
MKTRLGIVFWWIGALWLGAWAVGGLAGAIYAERNALVAFASCLAAGVFGAALAWSLCFIVAGSFWRAPRAPT